MKEGKYIVFKDGSVRVFKKHHVNAWMADGKPASSAGYFRTVNGKVECSRESGTLGIKAHEDDAEIIAPDMQMFAREFPRRAMAGGVPRHNPATRSRIDA